MPNRRLLCACLALAVLPACGGSQSTTPTTPTAVTPSPSSAPSPSPGDAPTDPSGPVNVTGLWIGQGADGMFRDASIPFGTNSGLRDTTPCRIEAHLTLTHVGDTLTGTLATTTTNPNPAGVDTGCVGYGPVAAGWSSGSVVTGRANSGDIAFTGVNTVLVNGQPRLYQLIELSGRFTASQLVMAGFLRSRTTVDANRNGQHDCILENPFANGECGAVARWPISVTATRT